MTVWSDFVGTWHEIIIVMFASYQWIGFGLLGFYKRVMESGHWKVLLLLFAWKKSVLMNSLRRHEYSPKAAEPFTRFIPSRDLQNQSQDTFWYVHVSQLLYNVREILIYEKDNWIYIWLHFPYQSCLPRLIEKLAFSKGCWLKPGP